MSDFKLTINISHDFLKAFHLDGYKLFLTQGVKLANGDKQPGNVIYSEVPSKQLASQINFTWSENYKVFMTDEFMPGASVIAGTFQYQLTPGNLADFESRGYAAIKDGINKDALEVANHWKNGARVGVKNQNTTIYISTQTPMESTRALIPVQYMGLFFGQIGHTDTMLDVGSTDIFYVDFATHKAATVSYDDGKWKFDGWY